MNDGIAQRISRIYVAIGATEETDPNKLRATVVRTDKIHGVFQDFRGGLSDEELSNQVHLAIHNIANLRDHLRRWAAQNGHDEKMVDQAVNSSFELQIILDLSNNDKHGYPPRNGGRSGRSPRLTEISRVMRLETQAKKGSIIAMTTGPSGVPRLVGNGSGKAVVTSQVAAGDGTVLGDLYEITAKAVQAWEGLLADFGLIALKKHSPGQASR